jgi:glutaredoxin
MDKTRHKVIIFSKEGCHLCEHAKAALMTLAPEFDFALEEVDITTDPDIFEQYQYTIPVMQINNRIVLETRIDAKKIRRAFAEGYGPKL